MTIIEHHNDKIVSSAGYHDRSLTLTLHLRSMPIVTTLHADFSRPVTLTPAQRQWQPSPQLGVLRQPLDRIGGEVARATSLVRYAPDSAFSPHVHGGGEEILVLEGTFSDEHGDFPALTYLRNPPGSRHTPRSAPGCLLFVKLWQFAADDHATVRLSEADMQWQRDALSGIARCLLHQHAGVVTTLIDLPPRMTLDAPVGPGGRELLLLSGILRNGDALLPTGTWQRHPPGHSEKLVAGPDGARLYCKTGAIGAPTLPLPKDVTPAIPR